MTPRHDDLPTLDQLQCLVSWPKGTLRAIQEHEAIDRILRLCQVYGIQRVRQMVDVIEDLGNDPDKLPAYQAVQRKHWAQMGWGEP